MCNSALAKYLQSIGVRLKEVNVGDRNISEYMQVNKNAEFGAETSGHIIIRSHALTGDGLFAALKVIKQRGVGKFLFNPNPTVAADLPVKNKHLADNEEVISAVQKIRNRLNGNGNGKIIVRQSGTEPVLRIFIEGKDKKELQDMLNELLSVIKKQD
jgi:phosphoglucosamine mutase